VAKNLSVPDINIAVIDVSASININAILKNGKGAK
jgi:hypothetical protein